MENTYFLAEGHYDNPRISELSNLCKFCFQREWAVATEGFWRSFGCTSQESRRRVQVLESVYARTLEIRSEFFYVIEGLSSQFIG